VCCAAGRRVELGESDDLSKVSLQSTGLQILDVLNKRDRQRLKVTARGDWETLWRSGRHCPKQTYETNWLVNRARADDARSSV
jgi:hypothetical protein